MKSHKGCSIPWKLRLDQVFAGPLPQPQSQRLLDTLEIEMASEKRLLDTFEIETWDVRGCSVPLKLRREHDLSWVRIVHSSERLLNALEIEACHHDGFSKRLLSACEIETDDAQCSVESV